MTLNQEKSTLDCYYILAYHYSLLLSVFFAVTESQIAPVFQCFMAAWLSTEETIGKKWIALLLQWLSS